MRKSLIVVLTALGGGAAPAIGDKMEPVTTDPAIWRWHVSAILDHQGRQEAESRVESISADSFEQRYVRYSTLGQPQRQH